MLLCGLNRPVFANCFSLEKITFSDTLKAIDDAGFCHATTLKELVLPPRLASIGVYAFAGCAQVKVLTP